MRWLGVIRAMLVGLIVGLIGPGGWRGLAVTVGIVLILNITDALIAYEANA